MPDTLSPAERLKQGSEALGLYLQSEQNDQLLSYLALLQRWNKSFNLTAVREESAIVVRHLLDSLSVLPHLQGDRLIDVGTGAGLPGIPLAIVSPERSFTLLDTNGKKTRFMVQAVSELGLENCEVIKTRVEEWTPGAPFDAVLSRAFASLADMIDTCRHLLAENGVFLAMKGATPTEEMAGIEDRAQVLSVTNLEVPGLNEARCLVALRHR